MGVYIHWPFCASKCPYCDFNSHVRGAFDQSEWVDAYVRSLEHYAMLLPDNQVVSIFFGGGTPSLMSVKSVATIIDAVQRLWRQSNDIEITLEANPTSVEIDKFEGFKEAGVTRISLGMQAFDDEALKFLGREHSENEALKAIEIAAKCFERYSFDLIYARPNQTLSDWEGELRRAIKYARGHLSLYQLTIEKGTPFYKRHNSGEFHIPDDVKGADFYYLTADIMEEAGLPAYEVSNYAAAGQECRHNLVYWHMADYIGVGAGAHGRFIMGADNGKYASRDYNIPERWLEQAQENGCGVQKTEKLTSKDRFIESIMMGLRLYDGISFNRCYELSGLGFFDMVDKGKLDTICNEGWAQINYDKINGDNMRLTREGMLRLNSLIPYILK